MVCGGILVSRNTLEIVDLNDFCVGGGRFRDPRTQHNYGQKTPLRGISVIKHAFYINVALA